uniref:Uncharacterized protein n=1 Tax=Vitis vinifera TaxID=29760 RepID=A5BUM2_VITVI|nr:hypothetical protein VITISV_006026 [Vitis vinifera]
MKLKHTLKRSLLLSPRVSGGPRCCYMDGHVILNTQGVLDSAVAPAKGIRTGCPDAPSDGFVSHGEREIYKSVGLLLGIKRLPGDPFLLRAKTIYIRMTHADHPDVLWRPSGCLRSA